MYIPLSYLQIVIIWMQVNFFNGHASTDLVGG
jgi:hypothetical protein